MLRKKGRLLIAGALLAAVLSLILATRSGEGPTHGAGCPVQALTCASGQDNPPDSASSTVDAKGGTPGDGAQAPGIGRAKPTTATPSTGHPSKGATANASGGSSGSSGGSSGGGTKAPTGPCASPAACGFPDADTTGPRLSAKSNKSEVNMTIKSDGMVISRWNLTGSLDIYANDVTVIDSTITSSNWWGVNLRPGYHGLRVLHSTITAVPGKGPDNGGEDYAVSNMGGSLIEVGWCDVAVFGNALSMGQGNLHDNYVHDIVPFINQGGEWQHADAVISDGGGSGQLIIRHNTLLNPVGLDKGTSASIGLYADTGAVTNTTVDGNWLAGGAYALYGGGAGATGIEVTDNVFSDQYHPNCGAYGPITAWNAGGAGNVWRGNRMSNGTTVTPQAS